MKKIPAVTVIGILTILLGITMFWFGVSMFTYQGSSLNPIVSELGKYSFFLWLPVLALGITLSFLNRLIKK